MSKITEISPLPKHVEAWARCTLLHRKRPIYTGKKVFIDSIKEWREEIIWVCDICQADENKNSEIRARHEEVSNTTPSEHKDV